MVATTLATPWKKWLLGTILGLLGVLGSIILAYNIGKDNGIQDGIDSYHEMCYTIGGIIIDESTGKAVACKGLGEVPKQELKKFRSDA